MGGDGWRVGGALEFWVPRDEAGEPSPLSELRGVDPNLPAGVDVAPRSADDVVLYAATLDVPLAPTPVALPGGSGALQLDPAARILLSIDHVAGLGAYARGWFFQRDPSLFGVVLHLQALVVDVLPSREFLTHFTRVVPYVL